MEQHVSIRLPENLIRDIDREAERLDRTRSWLIRDLLTSAMADLDSNMVQILGSGNHLFAPKPGNALKCATCGAKKAQHG